MKNLDNIIKLKFAANQKFGMMPYMEDEADDKMDGGCPEGYVQDGMKMVDGKEVPNCVPKKEQEEKDEMPEEFKYDWDQCVADQMERYGDEETAKKVCGAIKAGMRKDFKEGDDLADACWPGWHAEGLKEKDGKMVPNCVPDKK
jgi:hypothetical protein